MGVKDGVGDKGGGFNTSETEDEAAHHPQKEAMEGKAG